MNLPGEFSNVAAHLPAMAGRQPHRRAVVFPQGRDASGRVAYTQLTFQQLNELSDTYAHGLERIGIRRGVRTVLMVKPSLDFFALTFALFKTGAVIVMVDPGIGIENLGKCIAEAQPEAFIGIPKAHAARVLFRWGAASIRTLLTVGRRFGWGGHQLRKIAGGVFTGPYKMAGTKPDEVAAILFTSGSTGAPKGAVYSHGMFCAQVEMLRAQFGIEPGEVDLPTFPLFALFDPALGMTAVIPDMDATRPAHVDPAKIIEAIRDQGVTNMFGSPALLDRVSRYGEAHNIQLPSLCRAFSAGAPVSPVVLERFSRMLSSEAKVYTPYGATEALPVASIESSEILTDTRTQTARGGGYCIGRVVNPVEVFIIKITDEPIPQWSEALRVAPGEIGELVVNGPVVSQSYYGRDDLTALAKISEGEGSRVLHRMGDVGRIDEQGRLWFCGRKSQRVTTETGTLFTIPCEAIFNQHPAVFRSALVGIGDKWRQSPALCVELEQSAKGLDREQIRRELLDLGAAHEHTRSIRAIFFHGGFPVDIRHNAKIGREKLAVWAAQKINGSAA